MTREEQLRFCKVCNHKSFDINVGVICGLTGRPADFEGECEYYSENHLLKEEENRKKLLGAVQERMVGRGRRLGNFVLDSLIFFLFSLAAGFVLGSFLVYFWFDGYIMFQASGKLVSYLYSFILGMIYFTLFETITGRTPAKYITGTRVVNLDGSKPEFNTLLIRSLCRFIPLEPFSFLGSSPTGWHDRISKTLVVRHKVNPVQFVPQGYYPGVGQSFALTGLMILLMIAVIPVFIILFPLGKNLSMFIYYLCFAGVTFIIVRRWRKKHTGQGWFHFSMRNIRMLPLVALSAIALQTGLISPLVGMVPIPESLQGITFYETTYFTVFGILTAVVAAPVLEEFIFRGIMQDGLTQRIGAWKAILLTSFLFGLIHLNPWQFITAFLLGLFMGWLFYLTRDIILVITFHLVNNLYAVLAQGLGNFEPVEGKVFTILDILPQGVSQPLVIAISLLVAVVLAVYFGFAFKKVEDEPEITPEPPLIPEVILTPELLTDSINHKDKGDGLE